MAPGTLGRDLAFDELARRLNPRAVVTSLARGWTFGPDPAECAVLLRDAGLSEECERDLRALSSARLGAAANGSRLLRCDRGELEALARRGELGALLIDAIASVERAPAPPRIVGVINVTPDSFSDGGRFLAPGRAVEHALELEGEGADILEVGGESTRPGADAVDEATELGRVLPVVEGLRARSHRPICVDTRKAAVAARALDAGAWIVNDVSAGRDDPAMLPLVAGRECGFVAMHMQGTPAGMQVAPSYEDPVADVTDFLRHRVAACLKAGIDARRIVLDPGIGFGKRPAHNLEILRRLGELRSLGLPLMLGVSRKSFIGHVVGAEEADDFMGEHRRDRPDRRIGGTAAAVAACVFGGAELLRVHDVAIMREAALIARALASPESPA